MPKRVEDSYGTPCKMFNLKKNLYLNVAKKTDDGVNTVSHTKLTLNAVVVLLHLGI